MDKIRIEDLEVFAYHGVYEEEKEKGQKFLVCADMYLDTRAAGLNDDLESSVNYGDVCHLIKDVMTGDKYDLIETAAEHVAREILLEFGLVEKVMVEVKKPEAPIGLPFGMVSVSIERARHRAYIALGSNMGDTFGYLNMAIQRLNENRFCRVVRVSDFIVTKPYGGVEQDDFLNGALLLETLLEPQELLDLIHEIENEAGRERKIHWGPRTLDLDILFYDDIVLDTMELTIPHPEIAKRDFVLRPMAQIAWHLRHPLNHKSINEMYSELSEELCRQK